MTFIQKQKERLEGAQMEAQRTKEQLDKLKADFEQLEAQKQEILKNQEAIKSDYLSGAGHLDKLNQAVYDFQRVVADYEAEYPEIQEVPEPVCSEIPEVVEQPVETNVNKATRKQIQ